MRYGVNCLVNNYQTLHEPVAPVIGNKTNDNISFCWNDNRIFTNSLVCDGAILRSRCPTRVGTSGITVAGNTWICANQVPTGIVDSSYLKTVFVKMNRMIPSPIAVMTNCTVAHGSLSAVLLNKVASNIF